MDEQILINYTKEGEHFTLSILTNGKPVFYDLANEKSDMIVEKLNEIKNIIE